MPDFFETFFDPQRLNQLWKNKGTTQVEAQDNKAFNLQEVFNKFEHLVYSEYPDHRHGFQFFFKMARELVMQQIPSEERPAVQGKELQANQKQLQAVLDQIEDLLDAVSSIKK